MPTVCSMTIGTRPFALGDDQSEARGCDSREPLILEKYLVQVRKASRVGWLRMVSERSMVGERMQEDAGQRLKSQDSTHCRRVV